MRYVCLDCLHSWKSHVGDPIEWRCTRYDCRSFSIVKAEDLLQASKIFRENRHTKRPLRAALENIRLRRMIRMKSNLSIRSALVLMEVLDMMATDISLEETLDILRKKRNQ